MAGAGRRAGADLAGAGGPEAEVADPALDGAISRLLRRPASFGFLAAIRALRASGAAIRFRHDHRLDFPTGELRDVTRRIGYGDDAPRVVFEVTATFLGATGSSGPAPLYLVALAADESDAGELRRELLDVFHHRLYELFAGWMLRPARALDERPRGHGERRGLGLGALVGLGDLPLRALAADEVLSIAPLLLARGRPAPLCERALRRLLAVDLGDAGLSLEEYAGEWARLGEGGQLRLGDRRTSSLGRTAVMGAWCRDRQSQVRLRIGPIDAERLPHFAPGGRGHARIHEALALLLGDLCDVELELTIAGAPSPPLGSMRLGVDYRPTAPTQGARHLRFPIAPWRANPDRQGAPECASTPRP